jgi:hypothetical protein
VVAVGSCKWTKGRMPHEEMGQIRRLVHHIAPEGAAPHLYLFSRSGFEARLAREAEEDPTCHPVGVAELFGGA